MKLLSALLLVSLVVESNGGLLPFTITIEHLTSGSYALTIGQMMFRPPSPQIFYTSTEPSIPQAIQTAITQEPYGPYHCTYVCAESGQQTPFVSDRDQMLSQFINAEENSNCATTTTSTTTVTTTTPGSTPSNSQNVHTGNGGVSKLLSCFTADSTVETTKGRMNMADLFKLSGNEEIQILTAGGKFSPVAFWLHAEPQKSAEFLRLTITNGQSISLTRGHLVFKTDCDRIERQTVRAENIFPGDCLMVDTGDKHLQAQQVLKVDKFTSVGIFSPVIVSGDLLVDNILASCYSEVEAVQLQSIMFGYVDTVKSAAEQLLPDNFFSTIFGTDKNFSPIGEAFGQLHSLSEKIII